MYVHSHEHREPEMHSLKARSQIDLLPATCHKSVTDSDRKRVGRTNLSAPNSLCECDEGRQGQVSVLATHVPTSK